MDRLLKGKHRDTASLCLNEEIPCQFDQIADDRASGRHFARALAIEEGGSYGIPFDVNRIKNAIHGCQEMMLRNQGGMYPGLQFPLVHFGNGQQFDPVPEFPAELNVRAVISEIPLMNTSLNLKRRAKGQPNQDGQFVGSINAFYVVGRISLCIPLGLSLF